MLLNSRSCLYFLAKSSNAFSVNLKPQLPSLYVSAKICSKELRDPNVKKPKPFPYETKRLTYLHWYIDSTLKRMDENSKVIVVDGNIAAGKTTLAKYLAEQFDMKYIPEPTMEPYYITPYGYDLRKIDHLMPPKYKCCDLEVFYKNPHHENVGLFQMQMFMERVMSYSNALMHLLNTGQGIVMDRCVFSDFVFVEAMCNMGYIRKQVRDFYNKVRNNVVDELLRPHLIVYLDVTTDVALERIKKRNDPIEVNSKVLTHEYLGHIESAYKDKYLNKFSKHSEILIYDWNEFGDEDVIVEDIEKLNLEVDFYDPKFQDWFFESDWSWGTARYKYTNHLYKICQYSYLIPFDAPELDIPYGQTIEYRKLVKQVPGMKYLEGFNPDMNDKVLFKTHNAHYKDKTDYYPHLYEYLQ